MSSGKRYFAFSAAVFLVAALAAVGIVRYQDARLAAAQASDHLQAIDAVQRIVERQQTRDLALRAEMIASNQAVVSYLVQALDNVLPGMTVDYASVVDLLDERRQQLGLSIAGVIDVQGKLIAATEPLAGRDSFADMPAFDRARRKQTIQIAVLADGNRMTLIAIQPLAAYGTSEAYLLVGMPIDQAFAKSIATVGATEIIVMNTTSAGTIAAGSTLSAADTAAVLQHLPKAGSAGGQNLGVDIDGETYRASRGPLFGDTSAQLLALVPPVRSGAVVDTRVPIRAGATLALFTLIAVLAWLWLRILGPMNTLTGVIDYATVSGDLNLKAPTTGAGPVRRLAESFNRLCQRLRPAPLRAP